MLAAALVLGQPAAAPDAYARAVALQQAGDREGAAAAYREVLKAQPSHVAARSNLGVVLAQLGRYEEAIEAYRAALAVDPRQHKVRLNLGIALYKAARYGDAVTELAAVRTAEPDNLQARYLEADCHLRMGEPKAVIELLAPIEPSHQDDLALAYMLGLAYLQEKEMAKGGLLVDRILKRGESAEAHLMLGMAKRGGGDLAGGLEELGKAVALNPELPGVHRSTAAPCSKPAIAIAPRPSSRRSSPAIRSTSTHTSISGCCSRKTPRFDDAMAHFERALGVRPGDPGVRYQMVTIYVSRGESERALPLLEAIVKEAPEFLEAHVTLATVYYRLKRREDGDRERAIVDRLNKEIQAKQPGAVAPNTPDTPPVR